MTVEKACKNKNAGIQIFKVIMELHVYWKELTALLSVP